MGIKLKIKSLKFRILSWFSIILFIILTIFSYILYYLLEDTVTLQIKTQVYQEAMEIHEYVRDNENIKNIDKHIQLLNSSFILLQNNNPLYKSKNFSLENYKQYLNKDKSFFDKEVDEFYLDVVYVLEFEKPFKGVLIVSKKGLPNKAEDIENILLIVNPILLLILLFLGNKLINKIINPVNNLTKNIEELDINNFSTLLDVPKQDDEIKKLILTFNKMVNRLQKGILMMDRFNSDVSHEFKTPLTVIKGEAQLCLKKDRPIEYYKESLKTIIYEGEKLEKITKDLLFLTKYSKENIKNSFKECELDSIVLNCANDLEKKANEKNIEIVINKLEHIKIDSNKLLITTIIRNILDNAIKYSDKNTKVTISLSKKETISIEIQDQGIGIEHNEIEKITDKFYRIDKSRNKKIEGFGLGLSIVKNSLELIEGKLQIKSKINQGTKVKIIL